MDENVLLRIGRVVKTHGVTGEILVAPDAEIPDRILNLDSISIGKSTDTVSSYSIVRSRIHRVKKHVGVVMKVSNVESIDAARNLIGLHVYADQDSLPPLSDDEYFLDDLIDLVVVNADGESIGKVTSVLEYPGQLMLEIVSSQGARTLVPLVVPDVVAMIDHENGVIELSEWEGLIDE